MTVVLPAEYGVDPLGIGARLGLLPLGDVGQQVEALNAAADDRRAAQGAIVVAQERPFQQETVELHARAARGDGIQVPARQGQGAALFVDVRPAPVNYELHAEPDGAPAGYAQSYEKTDRARPGVGHADGAVSRAFTAGTGRTPPTRKSTVTLTTAGFYNHVARVPQGSARQEQGISLEQFCVSL